MRRLERLIVAIVLSLLFVAPARSAERELDEDTPPASASEITNPIERVFTPPSTKPALLPSIRENFEDWDPFFRDSVLEARLRSYYFRVDRTDKTLSEAWSLGGSLYYRSGWLADVFAVEVEGFTSQPLIAEDSKRGTQLLKPVQDGYSVLGIANGKLRYGGIELTGYRQYLDLPYVNRSDSRMTPNTFESITLAKPEGPVRFSAGYSWKFKSRTATDFESFTRSLGLSKDRGLIHGGVLWSPTDNIQLGAIAAGVPDLFAGVYTEMGYSTALTSEVEGRLDSQFTYQGEHGDDLLDDLLDETWNLGIRTSASWAGTVLRIGTNITGPNGSIFSPFGTNPSYADLMIRTFTAKNEKALLVSLSHDFTKVGANGLSAIVNFVAGFDGERFGEVRDAQELDLTVDYRVRQGPLQNFWLRVRGAWLREDDAPQDAVNVRVILRYDVPVI